VGSRGAQVCGLNQTEMPSRFQADACYCYSVRQDYQIRNCSSSAPNWRRLPPIVSSVRQAGCQNFRITPESSPLPSVPNLTVTSQALRVPNLRSRAPSYILIETTNADSEYCLPCGERRWEIHDHWLNLDMKRSCQGGSLPHLSCTPSVNRQKGINACRRGNGRRARIAEME
jgi:hypothetical protein